MAFNTEHIWHYYYYVAIFATILFVLKLLIYTIAGGDSEVGGDFNTETDSDVSFNFISIQSILAFLMGFGWTGYAGLKQLQMDNQIEVLIISFVVGFIFMFVSSALMFGAKKLEKNVKKDKKSAIGKTARAYTTFHPHSLGQIEVEINGQLSVVSAMNDTDEEINSFESVRVYDVIGDLLYITKI